MTDTHRFAMSAERWQGELWNVTLLPVVHDQDAKLLENLDERRRLDGEDASEMGPRAYDSESESLSASFEGQPKAVGW